MLKPADYAGLQRRPGGLTMAPPLDLKPWLLLAALIGFLVDALASLWLGGGLVALRATAAPLRAGAAACCPGRPRPRRPAIDAISRPRPATRLAYVVTGDAEVDETSQLGLEQLTRALDAAHLRRTRRARRRSIPRATSSPSIR